MTNVAPVAVIIPTFNRGKTLFSVLDRIQQCDPQPTEIIIHVDLGDGVLEEELIHRYPNIRVLASTERLGPGGGRHRCLLACSARYAASFDDDSYPVDTDVFATIERLFSENPKTAVFGASIWHRHEAARARANNAIRVPSFIGCGHAIRLAAYRQMRGYLPRPIAYEMEESDLSLQLFAAGWLVQESADIRVFHDTDLKHHESPEVTSGTITNIGLRAFLHYPVIGWGRGLLQVGNRVVYCIRMGRTRGILSGIVRIPIECYRNRQYRSPIAWKVLRAHFELRKIKSV